MVAVTKPTDRLGPDYRRLLAGAAASNLGDGLRMSALPLLAVSLTDDPVLVAGVTAAVVAPAILFGPAGGVVVDRFPRRRLIVVGQLLRAAAVAMFVAVLLSGGMTIAGVYLLAVALGAGEVVVDGASQAAVPTLVSRRLLARANARMVSAQLVLDQVIGNALGALLYSVRVSLPFVVDGLSYLIGAGAAAQVSVPLPPDTGPDREKRSMWHDAREGFAFLRRSPLLSPLLASIGTYNLAMATGNSVIVLLVVDVLDAPEASFGLVLGVASIAGFGTSLIVERLLDRVGRRAVFIGAGVGETIALAATGMGPNLAIVVVSVALSSACTVAMRIPGRSVRQEVTPVRLLGRVASSFRAVGLAGIPVGAALGGLLTRTSNARAAFVAASVLATMATVLLVRATRHLPPVSGGEDSSRPG